MRVAVVLAGGSGHRSGAEQNKVLVDLAGTSVLRRSVDAMLGGGADAIVVVIRPEDREDVAAVLDGVEYVTAVGAATRQLSEASGVVAAGAIGATGSGDVIAVHDAARPLVDPATVDIVFADAARTGAAYPAVERRGVWRVRKGTGTELAEPVGGPLYAAQTPQAARADVIIDAVRRGADAGGECTDTIDGLERYATIAYRVAVVPGDARNMKLTWPIDFVVAERLLAGSPPNDPTAVQSLTVPPTTEATDQYATLSNLESAVADAQTASDCLTVEGTDLCAACVAAEADGSLAQRPALARCVAAKRV